MQYIRCMRTTLDIDEDVLAAAKDLAKAEGRTMGQVISDLARKALTSPGAGSGFAEAAASYGVDDWPTFAVRGGPPVTTEMIRGIEDELDVEDATPWDHERDAPRVMDGARPAPARKA
jgi:hypothetical protein